MTRALLTVSVLACATLAGPVEEVADQVLATSKAGDAAALKKLAGQDDPDPWLVADELLSRGEADAAEAFAKAAPRKDVEKLPDYVASRRGKAVDAAARATLTASSEALAAGDFARALAVLDNAPPPTGDEVAAIRLAIGRGFALRGLTRLGESAGAFLTAARGTSALGWHAGAASAFHLGGSSAYAGSDYQAALAAWERCSRTQDMRGDRTGFAGALVNIGDAHRCLGNHDKAQDCLERALHLMEDLGDRRGVAAAVANLAIVHCSLGNYPRALACGEQALKINEELGDHARVAMAFNNIGIIRKELGDYPKALACQDCALRLYEERGDKAGIACALGNMGLVRECLSEYTQALECHERALRLMEGAGDRAGQARTLMNIGTVYHHRGDYAKALDYHCRSQKLAGDLGDRAGVAKCLLNIAGVHRHLGDYSKALELAALSLVMMDELGDRAGMAVALSNIGGVLEDALGDHSNALARLQQALRLHEEMQDRRGVARCLGSIGNVHRHLGDFPKALEYQERERALMEELGDRAGVAASLLRIGLVHISLSDYPTALGTLETALAEGERLGAGDIEARALWGLSQAHLASGNPAGAAACSRRAVEALGLLSAGLADAEGAQAREQFAGIFENGARAGLALGDTAGVSFFLESGRAMTLLESVGGRQRMQGFILPEELRKAAAETRAAESVAVAAYLREFCAGGDVDPLWQEVEGARGAVLEVAHRIQREAKAQASLVYPEAAPLERIRATLGKDEALVTYALLSDDAIALVVTREAARIVRLGKSEAITKAAATVQAAVLRPDERGVATPPHERLEFVAKRLRALVVEPLGLVGVTRLLVAPHAELAYVPFALLAPGLEVAYVPSGTTYGVLLDDAALRGKEVLALGGPPAGDAQAAAVYRGGEEFAPLPASRAEAQAVGDLVLVGPQATETGFVGAVASRPRWRAVHFACHGLVRADLPELSCLALGADAENDGFLTVLEVFRLKIPSDLVVLSACETAKGKVYRAEGVIGLARAFMLAGSPRVICSLWKVDDAATRELMTTFYKEWKPGVGAAAALRKAQQHVASQEKWKDPYFWAAWQLWGLPQ